MEKGAVRMDFTFKSTAIEVELNDVAGHGVARDPKP